MLKRLADDSPDHRGAFEIGTCAKLFVEKYDKEASLNHVPYVSLVDFTVYKVEFEGALGMHVVALRENELRELAEHLIGLADQIARGE